MTISNNKLLIGASGGGSDPINVEDVFSTDVWTAAGSDLTITNSIDISGEGGMIWIKGRNQSEIHYIYNTVSGGDKYLKINNNAIEDHGSAAVDFNDNGYDVNLNHTNGQKYVGWNFRKAPKFFDIVTYTGSGSNKTVSHNLGSIPGMIWFKKTSGSASWAVYHQNMKSSSPEDFFMNLDRVDGRSNAANYFQSTAPTDSVFSVGTDAEVNADGETYVAFLFAHNNSDGEYGTDGDLDIIKCGGYTGNAANRVIDVGFEPQWLFIKEASGGNHWWIFDQVRGWRGGDITGSDSKYESNAIQASAERTEFGYAAVGVAPNGFYIKGGEFGQNNVEYIYTAIRKGPTATITNASDVFAIDTKGSTGDGLAPAFRSTFAPDFALRKSTSSGNWEVLSRLIYGSSLRLNGAGAEDTGSGADTFEAKNGYNYQTNTISSQYSWMWGKARGFCDVVMYRGNGSNTTIKHALGVAPEMIWVKDIENNVNWWVFGGDETNVIGSTNSQQEDFDDNTYWNDTAPTASVFSLGTNSQVNGNNVNFIAFLFATLAGVSKVGTIAHSGSSTDVDCGFANGSKAVLLKRKDAAADWYWWDSVRGIVADEDPYLRYNTSAAQDNSQDYIDPLASGFQISGNFDDGTYLFYAIAA